MESIIRNVRDIEATERRVLERVLGLPLHENQQVVVQIVTPEHIGNEANARSEPPQLPDWFNVFEGLTDEELAEVESIIAKRLDLSR